MRGHQEGRGYHAAVEEHRGRGGNGKHVEGIEHPHQKRTDAHEKQVGSHPSGQADGKVELDRIPDESRREQGHHHRCPDDDDQCHGEEHEGENFDQVGGDIPGRFFALLVENFREDRDECRRYRTLTEEPPLDVGDPEGHKKSVGGLGSAEHHGNDDIADHAEHAREERHGAYDARGLADFFVGFRHGEGKRRREG